MVGFVCLCTSVERFCRQRLLDILAHACTLLATTSKLYMAIVTCCHSMWHVSLLFNVYICFCAFAACVAASSAWGVVLPPKKKPSKWVQEVGAKCFP